MSREAHEECYETSEIEMVGVDSEKGFAIEQEEIEKYVTFLDSFTLKQVHVNIGAICKKDWMTMFETTTKKYT